jgi:hypothetical protein
MNRDGTPGHSSHIDSSRRQLTLMSQLLKSATTMSHIDELFKWQGHVIIQYFDVQATQFWAMQADITGKLSSQLRDMIWQDASIPQHIFANNQVAMAAGQLLNSQPGYMLQRVGNVFSSHQAELFVRYGIQYCFCNFLRSSSLLPPAQNASDQEIPTPLAVVALLFLKQSLSREELSTITLILERSMAIAERHGLLLPASTTSGRLPALSVQNHQQWMQLHFSELIPHRLENANALRSSNPFAATDIIPDKQARRLYTAINGRKNVNEICESIGFNLKEAYVVLQLLLTQHRVELKEPGGQLVDSSLFFDGP